MSAETEWRPLRVGEVFRIITQQAEQTVAHGLTEVEARRIISGVLLLKSKNPIEIEAWLREHSV